MDCDLYYPGRRLDEHAYIYMYVFFSNKVIFIFNVFTTSSNDLLLSFSLGGNDPPSPHRETPPPPPSLPNPLSPRRLPPTHRGAQILPFSTRLVLSFSLGGDGTPCPPPGLPPSFQNCSMTQLSQDGGQHWTPLPNWSKHSFNTIVPLANQSFVSLGYGTKKVHPTMNKTAIQQGWRGHMDNTTGEGGGRNLYHYFHNQQQHTLSRCPGAFRFRRTHQIWRVHHNHVRSRCRCLPTLDAPPHRLRCCIPQFTRLARHLRTALATYFRCVLRRTWRTFDHASFGRSFVDGGEN